MKCCGNSFHNLAAPTEKLLSPKYLRVLEITLAAAFCTLCNGASLFGETKEKGIVVIQTGDNKSMDQLFGAVHIKVSTDTADAVQVGEGTLINLLHMN
jgi:hypothetical protein